MSKYRIVEVVDGIGQTFYKAQERFMWFFWSNMDMHHTIESAREQISHYKELKLRSKYKVKAIHQ